MPRPVIMDCDPGADDAVALLVAMASPEDFNILGITTVAGNVSLEQTTNNALRICELGGRTDIPVFAGCPRALINTGIHYEVALYGETGMGGSTMPAPAMTVQKQHAVNFIIETLMNSNEKITLLLSGPLTNIATALIMEPRIIDHVEEVILMGGAMGFGNKTPSAEFNLYCDPHAGQVVFNSGMKITMIGLDATHQMVTSDLRLAALRALGNEQGRQVAAVLEYGVEFDTTRFDLPGRAIHDVCVPIFITHRDLFKGGMGRVDVEINSDLTMGRTVVGWYTAHKENSNAFVVTEIDNAAIFNIILERLARYK